MRRKILAVMMTLMLVGIMSVGCGEQKDSGGSSTQGETSNVNEGDQGSAQDVRYKEEVVAYPEGQVFCMGKSAEGRPIAFLFDEKNTTEEKAAYKKYVYKNDEWDEVDISKTNDLLEKNKINMLYSLNETKEGSIFGVAFKEDNNPLLYALTDKFKSYPDAFGGNEVKNFKVVDDKSMLVMYGDGRASLNDFDGKSIREFGEGNALVDEMMDMVFTVDTTGTKIKIFDLATGKMEDEYSAEITNQGVCFAVNDKDEIYAATEKGIFLLENGTMTEVVSGDVMSTGALSGGAWLNDMFIEGDVFYLSYLVEEENSREYRMTSYRKE